MEKNEKEFIEAYIKVDEKYLTEHDKENVRQLGIGFLLEGNFWFDVAKEYVKRINKKK